MSFVSVLMVIVKSLGTSHVTVYKIVNCSALLDLQLYHKVSGLLSILTFSNLEVTHRGTCFIRMF